MSIFLANGASESSSFMTDQEGNTEIKNDVKTSIVRRWRRGNSLQGVALLCVLDNTYLLSFFSPDSHL